ncbi:MAG: ESPR domain-containing protein, partial [Neisseriaceae bacterium]|nr:ESPR domain-containing protein [Neisseriaceae bacterium]
MNKNLHKVIFNRNTGLMIAVCETAYNSGKSRKDRVFQVALFVISSDTIYAGKTYIQTGSTVSSINGETIISGSKVDIK